MDPLRNPTINLKFDPVKAEKVKSIIDPLTLNDDQIQRVMDTLHSEMWMGLSKEQEKRKQTSLQMENTYVRSLLDGTENGDFLALDLGGTNFRVLLCKMRNGVCESCSRNYNVPTEKLYGPAVGVFDHLAESIFKFLTEENMLDHNLPLGFTFSFPMVQEGINKGILVTWTKSFACPDGVGQDAVQLLEEALHGHGGMKVDVVAVLNDTTGTLLAGSYLDHTCAIGLIMGTGCNAAYVETLDNIDKWEGAKEDPKQVVIDTEWGAFGDNGSLDFVKTKFDEVIDKHSNHIGSFTFEKLFAGHYVGDIVRLVLVDLAEQGLLFHGQIPPKLNEWGAFTAGYISEIERDTDTNTENTSRILGTFDIKNGTSSDDIAIVRYLCSAISLRGAQLICACLAVLLKHMKRPTSTIAIDGSLYKYHPRLHSIMTDWLAYLVPDTKSKLILAEDGSGRGAAFVAAVTVRMSGK